MKTLKLVTGIITLALTLIVLFQSCAAGAYNVLGNNGEASGSAGFLVAILMIAGGVISISTRNSTTKGGSIAGLIVFGLAALLGFTMAGSFADLNVWAGWCSIMAVINIIAMRAIKKEQNAKGEEKL